MSTTLIARHKILGLVVAGATVMACSNGEHRVATTDTTTAAAAAPAPVDTTTSAGTVSNSGWTDGQILAFAMAANRGEIEEGRLAERKATNPAVKAFAREMVADHQSMLNDGKAFASKNGIAPDSTKGDVEDLMKDSRDAVRDLTDKQAGKDWDEDYIEKQIDAHKGVLSKLQDAEKATTNEQLKELLNKRVGKVQSHLTKAQDIKDNKLKS